MVSPQMSCASREAPGEDMVEVVHPRPLVHLDARLLEDLAAEALSYSS